MNAIVPWFIKGALIGAANIIPGVSGGTLALVLGIFERLIRAIERFGPQAIRELVSVAASPQKAGALRELGRRYDLPFLTALAAGAASAILAASRLMGFLIDAHPGPTFAFFFGLVAASLLFPAALLRRRSWPELACAAVAAAIVVSLTLSTGVEEKLEAARMRRATGAEQPSSAPVPGGEDAAQPGAQPAGDSSPAGDGPVARGGAETGRGLTPREADAAARGDAAPERDLSAGRILFLFAAGAASISAMALPGISGSFVLLLLGAYRDILRALDSLDLAVLGVFGLGCLAGLLLFVRLLRFLLERWYSSTVAFLGGLILGSLWSLWPFKRIPDLGGEPVSAGELWPYLENTWPAPAGATFAIQTAAALAGAAIVAGFFVYERRRAAPAGSARAQDIRPSGS